MLKFILLGTIQGLTEFLPVSSSGHLVLAQHAFHITQDIIFLDTFLHLGTVLAIFTFFFKDICNAFKNIRLMGFICLVTVITGAIGLIFKNTFAPLFTSPKHTAAFLIVNSFILILTKFSREKQKMPGILDSTLMGAVQGIAIIPGISRSGSTIATLLFRGIKAEEAFKFSFLSSIPAIIGAFLWEAKDTPGIATFGAARLLAGMAASYIFGLISLAILKKTVKNKKLHYFGFYCFAVGIIFLFLNS